MSSGCEFMKCEYAARDTNNNPTCSYDSPFCRYREEERIITDLKAEIARLREALTSIANDDMAVCDSCDAYQESAKAALEGGEHEQT